MPVVEGRFRKRDGDAVAPAGCSPHAADAIASLDREKAGSVPRPATRIFSSHWPWLKRKTYAAVMQRGREESTQICALLATR